MRFVFLLLLGAVIGSDWIQTKDLTGEFTSVEVDEHGDVYLVNTEKQLIKFNSRLDTLQAAILLEKLKIFEKEIELRNKIADLYREKFNNLDVRFQYIPKGYKSVYAQFSIVFDDKVKRDKAQSLLSKNNIPSVIYYSIPGHLQTGYKYLNYKEGDFPVSEKLSNTILSLPMHPYLEEKEIDIIVRTISKNI